MEDFYSLLGVERTATEAEIKTAYRKLAMKHHPDRGGDTATFQTITEAYNTLSDPALRARYDNPPQPSFHFGQGGPQGFEDIFSQMFGQRPVARPHNQNVRVRVTITLLESITGCEKIISLGYSRGGTQDISISIPAGVQPGSNIKYSGLGDNLNEKLARGDLFVIVNILQHPDFELDGSVLLTHKTINAFEAMAGTKLDINCVDDIAIQVTIPAGVQPGTTLRCPGRGGWDTARSSRGDLYVKLNVTIPAVTDEQLQTIVQWMSN
jgi:curved DNA-binding protein